MSQSRIQKIKAIVKGVATGDALGFPYQFKSRYARIDRPVIDMGITQDHEGNRYCLRDSEIGLWSDDTSLTLCLAESLAKGYNLKDQAERFIAWHDQGYLSALDHAFDVGLQTRKAIKQLKALLASGEYQKLSNLADNSDPRSNGNGALMRILPLITYIYHLDLDEQFRIVREVSTLTHPHIRSVICCFLYLKIAERLIDGKNKADSVKDSQLEVKEWLDNCLYKNAGDDSSKELDFSLRWNEAGGVTEEDLSDLRRLLNADLSQACTDPDDQFKDGYIRSDGYVVSSLEAALWCLLNSSNYRETILRAVNLGDDTDTTAAIAGGLAALYYGYDDIPSEWIARIQKPELFERIIALYEEK